MAGYQRIVVQGYMGHSPSTKTLQSGDAVTEFSIAVSGYKDETEWFRVKAFKKNAENIDKFFTKGDMILVEGKMQTSSWEKDGQKKSKTELIVDRWAFCGGEKKEKPKQEHDPNRDYVPPDDDNIPF